MAPITGCFKAALTSPVLFPHRILSCQLLQVWDRRGTGWLDPSPCSSSVNPVSRRVHSATWRRCVPGSQSGLLRDEIRGCGRCSADSPTGRLPNLPQRVERWGETPTWPTCMFPNYPCLTWTIRWKIPSQKRVECWGTKWNGIFQLMIGWAHLIQVTSRGMRRDIWKTGQ